LAARWTKIRDLRRVVTGALEKARAEKKIGASLQAHPVIYVDNAPDELQALSTDERSEMFITSGHEFKAEPPPPDAFQLADVPGIAVQVTLADGQKCDRCWRVLPDVGTHAEHPTLCGRCADVVAHLPAVAS
jgi:isoleucyl-tRNA synthetase